MKFKDFELSLYGNFAPRDYCVQYRETDFNFVSRLMEEEGIYYFFKFTKGAHKLVLANTPQSHPDIPGGSQVIFDGPHTGSTKRNDLSYVHLSLSHEVSHVVVRNIVATDVYRLVIGADGQHD